MTSSPTTATSPGTVTVIGAGLAGLAAAVRATALGRPVRVIEAANQAGGRCRSFHDMVLDRVIDNGNHLILGANTGVFDFLHEIGAQNALTPLDPPDFNFIDLSADMSWTLRPGVGRLPWWLLHPHNRIPGSRLADLRDAYRLAMASEDSTVADCVDPAAPLFERFWQPLARAILNTDATEGSAQLLWRVIRETLLTGAAGSRPYLAAKGLSAALVDPALDHLRQRGVSVSFGTRIRGLEAELGRAKALVTSGGTIEIAPEDTIILAIPPSEAQALLPDLTVPTETRPIVNLHYRVEDGLRLPGGVPFIGLVGSEAQWVFNRGDILSVTVSAASALAAQSAEAIAATVWAELARVTGAPGTPIPPHRVIKEQRATIAQTPAQLRLRPPARTRIGGLFLAGDWTDTGLPATVDGAIRSGFQAAEMAASGN